MLTDINVLRLFIFNGEFRLTVYDYMHENMFLDQSCSDLYNLVKNYYEKNGHWTKKYKILISDNPLDREKERLEEMFKIVDVDENDFIEIDLDVYIKKMEEWIKNRMFRNVLRRSFEYYENHDEEEIDYFDVETMMKEINEFTLSKVDWEDSSDALALAELHIEDVPRVRSGWAELDEFLKGGFKKKSVNVFQGGTGVGKSRLLLSLATAMRSENPGNNILYITLELSDKDFLIYSDTHLFEMKEQEIRNFIETEGPEEYIKKKKELDELYGKFLVKEFPSNSASSAVIRALIEKVMRKEKNLHAVFIDYIGCMKEERNYNILYEKGMQSIHAIRGLSQEYEIPFFTAVQPNREGSKKNRKSGTGATIDDVGESKGIPDASDFFANIIQTDTMFKNDQQILYVLKNRHSERKFEPLLLEVVGGRYQVDVVPNPESVDDDMEIEESGVSEGLRNLGVPDV